MKAFMTIILARVLFVPENLLLAHVKLI